MARKVEDAAKKGAPRTGAPDELAILHPEGTTVIGGREITVREYGFVEAARLDRHIRPLIEGLHHAFGDATAIPSMEAVAEVLATNIDDVLVLIAAATDQDKEWISGLSYRDGEQLQLLWWRVNGHFFIERLMRKVAAERLARSLAGPSSTQSSSGRATDEPPPKSGDTPSGS
ncbi:DUF6631 family protein [Stenotrophomonas sp. G106K1]|uniref:DUF6631 family protein n=1 Tax=Stenotrophomonas sp. G106K1 TaxID=3134792 RepID=UPI0030F37E7A